jgi:hypothetical protein
MMTIVLVLSLFGSLVGFTGKPVASGFATVAITLILEEIREMIGKITKEFAWAVKHSDSRLP